jgi:hypothetical protein
MPTRRSPGDELTVVAGPGRHAGERRVLLTLGSGARAHGLWSDAGARPWVDLACADPAVLAPLARALGAGGAIMVAYGDGATAAALRRRVPPPATPLGLALLEAGCRWFKDWYFAEGGREGPAKLLGELPLDDAAGRRQERCLREELAGFLASGRGQPADRDRAGEALRLLGGAS